MIDLKTFPTLFEKAQPTNGDTFDLRFEEALTLVEQDQFDQAAPLIETILKEGCLDIRLIMHLFYAHFLQEGVQSFLITFPHLVTLINNQWEKLSPINKRESHASKSILWFLASIGKRMKRSVKVFKQQRPDFLWTSTSSLHLEKIETIEKQTNELQEFFSNTWQLPLSQQYTQYILTWLKEIKNEVPITTLILESPLPQFPASPEKTSPLLIEEIDEKKNTLERILLSSQKMKELHLKLQLFETLLNEKQFMKGALVGDDIKNTINSFNPSLFFPKLFSKYYALVAQNIDTLSMEWDNKDSPKWDSLNHLFQIDLKAFVDW